MKAFQLMVFMMLFNFSVFIVGGLHIYNMNIDPSEASSEYNLAEYSTSSPSSILTSSFLGTIILWAFAAIATATVVSYFTKGKSVDGVIYGIFGGTYWAVTKTAFDTFSSIFPKNEAIDWILVIYGIMLGVLFVIGLFQMVRGGWEAYQ